MNTFPTKSAEHQLGAKHQITVISGWIVAALLAVAMLTYFVHLLNVNVARGQALRTKSAQTQPGSYIPVVKSFPTASLAQN